MKYDDNPEKEKRKLVKNNFVIKGLCTRQIIKYGWKYSGPKTAKQSNLSPRLVLAMADWFRTDKTIV